MLDTIVQYSARANKVYTAQIQQLLRKTDRKDCHSNTEKTDIIPIIFF